MQMENDELTLSNAEYSIRFSRIEKSLCVGLFDETGKLLAFHELTRAEMERLHHLLPGIALFEGAPVALLKNENDFRLEIGTLVLDLEGATLRPTEARGVN